MYTKYYGLTKKPFENTPDPDFLFLSKNHREVLASLEYAINTAKGFVLVVGDIGTGKTTLIHALIQQLDSSFITLNITNPRATFKDILHYLGEKVGIASEKTGPLDTVETIQNRLETLHERDNKHAVLIVDEAHLLSDEALEDVRLISNIENEKRKLIQIVLVGQNELGDKLRRGSLRPLQQRLVVTRRLIPLNRKEMQEYISHRLGVAEKESQLFEIKALSLIWKKSRGVPRLINQICDNALLIGYAVEARSIGGKIIKEVIGDMESVNKVKRHGALFFLHRIKWIGVAVAAALLIVYLGAGLINGGRFFSKNWIFWKDSHPTQTVTPAQSKNSLPRQNGESFAKGHPPVETEVPSRTVVTGPFYDGIEKPSTDRLVASEKERSGKEQEPSSLEKEATKSRKSNAPGELNDKTAESSALTMPNQPKNIENLSAGVFQPSEKKRSIEENEHLVSEQHLNTNTRKSVTGGSQPGVGEKNKETDLLQKRVDFGGSELSKTTDEKFGDSRKWEVKNRRKVRANEWLYDLANREYGIRNNSIIDLIHMANPGIRDVNRIYPGQEVILPYVGRKNLIVKDENGMYHIHYASFYHQKTATLCAQGLNNRNQEAFVISTRQGDNLVYRVYLGTFKNRGHAEKVLDTLDLEYFSFLPKNAEKEHNNDSN